MLGWILSAFLGLSSPAVALIVGIPAAYIGYQTGHTVGHFSGEKVGRKVEKARCEASAEKARVGMEKANADRADELKKIAAAEEARHKAEEDKWKAGTTVLEGTLAKERADRKNVALQCWSVEVVRGIKR